MLIFPIHSILNCYLLTVKGDKDTSHQDTSESRDFMENLICLLATSSHSPCSVLKHQKRELGHPCATEVAHPNQSPTWNLRLKREDTLSEIACEDTRGKLKTTHSPPAKTNPFILLPLWLESLPPNTCTLTNTLPIRTDATKRFEPAFLHHWSNASPKPCYGEALNPETGCTFSMVPTAQSALLWTTGLKYPATILKSILRTGTNIHITIHV